MASIGDDKEIRALFSELTFVDEQTAPSFTAVWHSAQARQLKPQRAFNLSFVAATALLVFSLASLAVWSKYSQPKAPASASVIVPAATDFVAKTVKPADVVVPVETGRKNPAVVRSRRAKSVMARQAIELANNRLALKNAQTIASWQSPTASLLSSPSDGIFKSLPQLNENANEMKSFLPSRRNEKEK